MTRIFEDIPGASFGSSENTPFKSTQLRLVLALFVLGTGACGGSGGEGSGGLACESGANCKITALDGAAGDFFGRAVAIDGNVIAVGATGNDSNGISSGAAYTYRFDGEFWQAEQRLTPTTVAPGDFFGSSVDVDGDVIVVGAMRDDGAAVDSGTDTVYRFNAATGIWDNEATLAANDAAFESKFGNAVAVDGDVIAVASRDDFVDDANIVEGAVYVYNYNAGTKSWSQAQKIGPPASFFRRSYGISISLDGDVLVIGDNGVSNNGAGGPNLGSIEIYRFDGNITMGPQWVSEDFFIASDFGVGVNDNFGGSVSVKGDVIVVGAGNSKGSGSAEVIRYDSGTWSFEQRLVATDASEGDFFGGSVSIGTDVIVVGAPFATQNGAQSGSVYVFRYDKDQAPGMQWSEDRIVTASDSAVVNDFGVSVSVSGEVTAAGVSLDNPRGNLSGSAYAIGL
jgi:hypothetical protein